MKRVLYEQRIWLHVRSKLMVWNAILKSATANFVSMANGEVCCVVVVLMIVLIVYCVSFAMYC